MSLWQDYHQPKTISEALMVLEQYQGQARVIGGGTDLLLEMQQGHKPPVQGLVDITAINELRQLRKINDWVEVGAALTHSEIVQSALLTEHATCLVESCGVIGGPQVRNVGTLGGNVAHALPAADGTTALTALDAQVEVIGPQGPRWQAILDLFSGAGKSTVDHSRELISRFRFRETGQGQGSAFKRIMRPQGVALPILACAVWLEAAGECDAGFRDDVDPTTVPFSGARICIGPLSPVPVRLSQAEDVLVGTTIQEGLAAAISAAQAQFSPRTSKHRATAEYRHEMIEVLLRRALPLAAQRAVTGRAVPEGIGQ